MRMKPYRIPHAIVICIIFLTVSCCSSNTEPIGQDVPEKHSTTVKAEQTPSKELMINRLNILYNALENKNFSEAAKYFVLPEGMKAGDIESSLSQLIEKKEISKKGIEILSRKASFGRVSELYGKDGLKKAKRFHLDPDQCYALGGIENSGIEVMGYWNGNDIKFFRLDNVGKLSDK